MRCPRNTTTTWLTEVCQKEMCSVISDFLKGMDHVRSIIYIYIYGLIPSRDMAFLIHVRLTMDSYTVGMAFKS